MSTINPIAKIGDVIRGSLLADRPEQIPLLLQSVTERVTALEGKFYIKNFWADPKPLSLGYVGVHIKIRMPIPSNKTNARGHDQTGLDKEGRKYILMELQLHVREIMDGTKDCAKEIAHLLYKAPQEAEEKISQEIISSSQLVYLTAMTKLLASKEDLEKVEDTLHIIQAMTKADKKMRLVMETAMLLGNKQLKGEWNEQLQVVVPKDRDAVAAAWMGTAEKINKLLNLPIVKMDESDVWTNTATSVEELYANAKQITPFFRDMCKQAADSQPGCSVNFGPKDRHMIKETPSLLDKIKADLDEELGQFMTLFLKKIGRSLVQITGSNSVRLESLSGLQSLNFSGCSQITDSDLGFLGSLSALHNLSLSDCSQITDRSLAYLERLTGLRSLNLSGCRITDRGLTHLENLTSLQSLNLSYCSQITDRGLVHLWRLSDLQTLNRVGCDQITDRGLALAGLQRLNPSHQNPNPLNPSQPAQATPSPAASEGTQPTKDAYLEFLLRLLENLSIQGDSSLLEILEREAQELMDQETKGLTVKQNKSFQLVQKLFVDQKVSQFIAKNLRKLHAPNESKRPPAVLQTPASFTSFFSVDPLIGVTKSLTDNSPSEVNKVHSPALSPLTPSAPPGAFGEKEWTTLCGRVAPAPPLPSGFSAIWNGPCPIYPDKKISDTHMLVYIPATVDGKPLTFKSLGEIARHYFQNTQAYESSWEDCVKELGDRPIDKVCWALMTKDVLPASRNKSYGDQKTMVSALAKKALALYEVPQVLEAAVCILTHYFSSKTYLFGCSPLTCTRCQENISRYQRVVGGFGPSGLDVTNINSDHDFIGVAALRKF